MTDLVEEAPAGSSRSSGRGAEQAVSRLAIIGIVVAVVALAGFADRSATKKPAAAIATAMPVAAPAAALSSSWFCAGPTSGPAGSPAALADGKLVIANAEPRPLSGTVMLIPSSGSATSEPVRVPPSGQVTVSEKLAPSAPYLGAVVNLDGGQAAVQQVVTGTAGTSSTACATTGSSSWYFPGGTTQESSTLSISLLNPYPEDAIADLSFTTDQGQENPQDFQGIVIPAGTVTGFDIGSHLHGRASVATTVTLRTGRIVAFETEAVQAQSQAVVATQAAGTVPWPPGLSLTQGAPSPGTSWWWPSGSASDGTSEKYVMYNPGDQQAEVLLLLDLDQGSADPFRVTVDPHSIAVVVSNAESRIPKGIGHGASLTSSNGVGVVAERLVQAKTPAKQTGLAQVLGSRLRAGRWLLPLDGVADAASTALVVYNPGTASVRVSISTLDGAVRVLDGPESVTIPPGHRDILTPEVAGPLLVTSSGPVVVESDTSPPQAIGIDAAIGVPLDQ